MHRLLRPFLQLPMDNPELWRPRFICDSALHVSHNIDGQETYPSSELILGVPRTWEHYYQSLKMVITKEHENELLGNRELRRSLSTSGFRLSDLDASFCRVIEVKLIGMVVKQDERYRFIPKNRAKDGRQRTRSDNNSIILYILSCLLSRAGSEKRAFESFYLITTIQINDPVLQFGVMELLLCQVFNCPRDKSWQHKTTVILGGSRAGCRLLPSMKWLERRTWNFVAGSYFELIKFSCRRSRI